MTDLISRQKAIDALEREQSLVERPITETRWFDLGLRKAQDVLSELPSAQPNLQPNLQLTCNQLATDCISRKAAIDVMRQNAHFDDFDVSVVDEKTAITALKGLPSAGKEIIRCKDCKYYRRFEGYDDGHCCMAEWYKRYQYPDDFCSRAERREDGLNQ